jgi:large subunit ribosomal protein L9
MASAVQVILTEDSTAGKAGELRKVRPGYARNFLFPKGLAVIADAFNMSAYEARKAEIERLAEEKKQRAEATKEKIGEDAVVEMSAKAGESGKLFGAVTKEKIASAINEDLKIELSKENIQISSPIKSIGQFKVALDLGSNVKTEIRLKVSAEN